METCNDLEQFPCTMAKLVYHQQPQELKHLRSAM